MLRQAVSGNEEEQKKRQEEQKKKREEEEEKAAKIKVEQESAKKAQTGTTMTPSKAKPVGETASKETPNSHVETPATKQASTAAKKKPLPKGSGIQRAPRNLMLADDSADYSHIYRNFYDIFVGSFTDQKQFDLNFALRETRNVYASFVNLMENSLLLSQKHKFDKHPLEMGYNSYKDYHNA